MSTQEYKYLSESESTDDDSFEAVPEKPVLKR